MPSVHPETGGFSESDRSMMGGEIPKSNRLALARKKEVLAVIGDLTAEQRRILSTPIFQPGEIVTVKRSGGRVDSGWKVVTPLTTEGRVVVTKQINGRYVTKGIMESALVNVNPGEEADNEEIEGELQPREPRVFEKDEIVVVERGKKGSGDLDPGWTVVFPLDEGMVVVSKTMHGGSLIKRISPKELEKWNPRTHRLS